MFKFKAVYEETERFLGAESQVSEIEKSLAVLIIDTLVPTGTYNVGDVIPITIAIINRNGIGIDNLNFTLNINNTNYSRTTDNEGLYTFNHTLVGEDNLDITITTVANDIYQSAVLNKTIEIDSRVNTNISLTTSTTSTSFKNSFTIKATLTDESGNAVNGQIDFYQDGTKIKTLSTSGGVASFSHTGSVGTHSYYAVFGGDSSHFDSTSKTVNVTLTKDTPTITALTGDIYQDWVTACVLKDSKGNVLSGKTVRISVSRDNSSFSNYDRTTDSSGKAKLTMNCTPTKVYVKYIFSGDSQYNAKTLTTTFTILSPKSVSKYVGTIVSNPASDSAPYRKWYDTYTNGDDNNLRAGNTCSSAPIGGKNGSYNRPANIEKSGFGFNIPTTATITKIVCTWKSKQVTCSSNTAYISIPAGTVKLTGSGSGTTLSGTGTKGGNGSYTSSTVTWSNPGATPKGVNSPSMKLVLSHGANTTTNPGLFYVIGPTLTVYYNPAQGSV